MKNFEGAGKYVFNPEEKFLEHTDKNHEALLERKKIDHEYQKNFRNFFLTVFNEANIDIPDILKDILNNTMDVYCSLSLYIHEAVTPHNPQKRLLLDVKMRNNFFRKKGHNNLELSDNELK